MKNKHLRMGLDSTHEEEECDNGLVRHYRILGILVIDVVCKRDHQTNFLGREDGNLLG